MDINARAELDLWRRVGSTLRTDALAMVLAASLTSAVTGSERQHTGGQDAGQPAAASGRERAWAGSTRPS